MYDRLRPTVESFADGMLLLLGGNSDLADFLPPRVEVTVSSFPGVDMEAMPYADASWDYIITDQVLRGVGRQRPLGALSAFALSSLIILLPSCERQRSRPANTSKVTGDRQEAQSSHSPEAGSQDVDPLRAEEIDYAIRLAESDAHKFGIRLAESIASFRGSDSQLSDKLSSILVPLAEKVGTDELIEVLEVGTAGETKELSYQFVLSYLSNTNLGKLADMVEKVPPSRNRQKGYLLLYRKTANTPESMTSSLESFHRLEEPEDIEGALQGLFSAKWEMINAGVVSQEDIDELISAKLTDKDKTARKRLLGQ